jgi:hypothetical protein
MFYSASGLTMKDLSIVGHDIKRTVLVDNTPYCFLPQPENGIPCTSFYAKGGPDKEVRVQTRTIIFTTNHYHYYYYYGGFLMTTCNHSYTRFLFDHLNVFQSVSPSSHLISSHLISSHLISFCHIPFLNLLLLFKHAPLFHIFT